jgi:hypothetical protein
MTDRTTTNQQLERVTVNLVPRAARALEQVTTLTGYTKTDVINRALQLYAYIEQVVHDQGAVFVQGAGDAKPQQIKIF